MPDIAVTLAYWELNPQFYLHIEGAFPKCVLHADDFEEETAQTQHLRDLVPNSVYGFIAEAVRQTWGIMTRESVLDGYGTQFKLEVETTLNLRPPFTANLQPLVDAAERVVGVATDHEISQSTLLVHPHHDNKPLTPELMKLGKRFTIAVQKMAER